MPEEKKRSVWKWIIGLPILTLILLIAVGACLEKDPEFRAKTQAREAIKMCWEQQSRKSLTPGEARFIAGACEKMEQEYREKYRSNP
jgi:hypothetical protein